MTSKNARERLSVLSRIPRLAQIDHRHFTDGQGNHPLISNLSRNERRKLDSQSRKIIAKYRQIMMTTAQSGAGYPVDQLLRYLALEYTHRYASSGTGNQPISFNYFESFCNIKLINGNVAPYAEPLKEVDNLFSITDYFDFITSKDAKNFKLTSLVTLPENLTFHYTCNGDILDLTFLNASGREFVISGFSMVRRKNSMHWYLLGGEVCSDEEWKVRCENQPVIEMEQIEPSKRAFLSEAIAENGNSFGPPLPLEGTKTAIRTIITGEIDLVTQKYLGRCIMAEHENSFMLFCDDPDVFLHSNLAAANDERVSLMIGHIEKAPVMWDLVGSMFQLPAYFDSRINVSESIVKEAGKTVAPMKSSGGRGIDREFKKVPALQTVSREAPVIQQVLPVYYKTETEGHWRRLNPNSIGKGPHGEEEVGRTWVKAKNTWRETERKPRTIYVKSTLQAAKLKVEEYLNAAESDEKKITNEESIGVLYVLRCAAMKDEIYKVGWTSRTATERAKELSSSSGVPKSFIVVDAWDHHDPAALETNVHAMLDPYRFNDRREFFHAPYKSIKTIIETELKRMGD